MSMECTHRQLHDNGFTKCPFEHALHIKKGDGDNILIICLYINDLLFTGNNEEIFQDFKQAMF